MRPKLRISEFWGGEEHHQLGDQARAGHACACELGFVLDDEPWNTEVPFSQPAPISKDVCVCTGAAVFVVEVLVFKSCALALWAVKTVL